MAVELKEKHGYKSEIGGVVGVLMLSSIGAASLCFPLLLLVMLSAANTASKNNQIERQNKRAETIDDDEISNKRQREYNEEMRKNNEEVRKNQQHAQNMSAAHIKEQTQAQEDFKKHVQEARKIALDGAKVHVKENYRIAEELINGRKVEFNKLQPQQKLEVANIACILLADRAGAINNYIDNPANNFAGLQTVSSVTPPNQIRQWFINVQGNIQNRIVAPLNGLNITDTNFDNRIGDLANLIGEGGNSIKIGEGGLQGLCNAQASVVPTSSSTSTSTTAAAVPQPAVASPFAANMKKDVDAVVEAKKQNDIDVRANALAQRQASQLPARSYSPPSVVVI